MDLPVRSIRGIGTQRAATLSSLGIEKVGDLIYYFPRAYIDLSRVMPIGKLRDVMDTGEYVSIMGTVRTFDTAGSPPKQRFVLVLDDGSGFIPLVFFQQVRYFKNAFSLGDSIAASGKVTSFQNRPQMLHPDLDRIEGGAEPGAAKAPVINTRGIIPKYTIPGELKEAKLQTKSFRRVMRSALDQHVRHIPEFLPSDLVRKYDFLPLHLALTNIHFPSSQEMLEKSRRRLKFDELFLFQLMLAVRRNGVKSTKSGIRFSTGGELFRRLHSSLPFELTAAQRRVLDEIAADMRSDAPMNRLLQGDVGSGKTVVALLAMLIAVENGYQAAFMAPTEVLAEQHYKSLRALLKDIPVNVRLLVSGQKKRVREDILEDVRSGGSEITVGTHALIQEGVAFSRLGLAVIDEQHRFGVAQRMALRENNITGNIHPDILVMTATPIPRTLALTLYGDLDVSTIDELPANRKSIRTAVRFESQREKVWQFVRSEVAQQRQAYIVYPLVEESEKLDLKAATESFEELRRKAFPELRLGLIHGRLSMGEKEEIMMAFRERKLDVLVATTVIEVGIDVPNASTMIIEHAERFGLSQLHQLRGRVGRGAAQSYCILMAPEWVAPLMNAQATPTHDGDSEAVRETVVRRLQAMVETLDGFKIAETDLELRGPGDFFGTRQSGRPLFQLANLVTDSQLLSSARREAFELVDHDPHLQSSSHHLLRHRFEEQSRDALNTLQTG